MKVISAVLLCICALAVEGAPRAPPSMSETFSAQLLVQYIGGSCNSEITRDATAGKQYWNLLNEPENIYAYQYLDYADGMSYNLLHYGPVQGCLPIPASGSLPKFWDWLSTAEDAGKAEYMNTVVEVYAGKDEAGNYRELGVSASNPSTPVYTVISTDRTSVQFTWLEYTTNFTRNFGVPMECQSAARGGPKGMLNFLGMGLPIFTL